MFRKIISVKRNSIKHSTRNISKYLDKEITCKAIREHFLDYFINNCNHNFVRSSPVVPFNDPSVAFVNAGMNQFKGILLGKQTPVHKKVANSQKCIRVGGKHNDLNIVGLDGYHHTFFEMLGNWSFGDYFKKEACEMAWNLLTKGYKINENLLYVTYFAGDDFLKLPPDIECRDIWKNIGIPEERILPFGSKDNFWEMGPTGPCGPCTEIHVDLLLNGNRAQFVNMGLPDLTELWNIVFIQYNRCLDGTIQPLPQKHIDTGMGLERLVAFLQGKVSNYDTDVFTHILAGISKSSKNIPTYGGKFGEQDWDNLDTNYRILADHSRMVTVCLADGIIPEKNQKLRRIMRKIFHLSETAFKKESGLLKEISNYVVEGLGSTYPEMEKNIKEMHQVIDYEEQLYKYLKNSAASEWKNLVPEELSLLDLDVIEMPGLIAAYKDIKSEVRSMISSEFGFKLYDTYGLNEKVITKLSSALNITFDVEGFRERLSYAKSRSRNRSLINTSNFNEYFQNYKEKKTDNSYKYKYHKDKQNYIFDKLNVEVLKVFQDSAEVTNIQPNAECDILLDKSNLYYEAGGQVSDKGTISFNSGTFKINNVVNSNGYLLHQGILSSTDNKPIPINTRGEMLVDGNMRLSNMKNHTATHLLNSALKKVKGVTYQKSSAVNSQFLNLDVGLFGTKFTIKDVKQIEQLVNETINRGVDVRVSEINDQQLLSLNDVTLLPGEIYPETGIRLIEIVNGDYLLSREPCCGTHVLNTRDIESFCIVRFDSLGRSTTSIFAVTGERAKLAIKNGEQMLKDINAINLSCKHTNKIMKDIANIRDRLNYSTESCSILPVIIKYQCRELLQDISRRVKASSRTYLRNELQDMMLEQLSDPNKKYVVHHLLNTAPLHTATNLIPNLPVIILSYFDNKVKARCCVPEHLKNEHFDAKQWLTNSVGMVLNSSYATPKGEDLTLVCNMKSKRISNNDWNVLLEESIKAAKNYAEKYLQ